MGSLAVGCWGLIGFGPGGPGGCCLTALQEEVGLSSAFSKTFYLHTYLAAALFGVANWGCCCCCGGWAVALEGWDCGGQVPIG